MGQPCTQHKLTMAQPLRVELAEPQDSNSAL